MDIVEFLKARLDEDEREARICLNRWATEGHGTRRRWDQQLREVAAKRRIVDLAWHHLGDEEYGWGMEEAKRQMLGILATVYADHPDYDPGWAAD